MAYETEKHDTGGSSSMVRKPILERHIQTLLLAVVAGLIAWQGVTTMTLVETSARQDERIGHLIKMTERMDRSMSKQEETFMPSRDAAIYREQMNGRITYLEKRVEKLENEADDQ